MAKNPELTKNLKEKFLSEDFKNKISESSDKFIVWFFS